MGPVTRVVLVGFMGCGKTVAGEALARHLGATFVDLDTAVAASFGMGIPEIFATRGEQAFRREETRRLEVALQQDPVVIAAGGGAFCRQENRALIARRGALAVFLDPPWEVLAARLEGTAEERPKFVDAGQARALFEARYPAYLEADLHVRLDGSESPEAVARRVAEELPAAP